MKSRSPHQIPHASPYNGQRGGTADAIPPLVSHHLWERRVRDRWRLPWLDQIALSPFSPVLILITSCRSYTKILPSPMLPVFPARMIVSTTLGAS